MLWMFFACSQLPEGAAPEFALEDVNPTSVSFGTQLGTADAAGQVSAWYFGHAT